MLTHRAFFVVIQLKHIGALKVVKYINKSGTEIEINDTLANVQAAEKAGWTKASNASKKTKKQAK